MACIDPAHGIAYSPGGIFNGLSAAIASASFATP